ncbi:hypothetical protein Syn7502_03617 (plasmid) [Synechococcus sp. PCC 7502]|uniref:hypothetical protein n=1 Tax=Synechococcus sp. PCC 7502 TaxID=1173263 RepID=UPI00029F8693|nr:hypothetical protein [Synechococcus sp. PCC 7502]AFY75445.1 hypothetical protein Syn7502_03617 [Synechococcus sp. PCC 7502]
MLSIKKQIVTDEASKPVAVVINYHDWQRIEALLAEREQNLLSKLATTSAVVWSPQVDQQAISSFTKSLIDQNLDSFPIMQLAETGFAEWNDPEEDIYNDVA